MKANEFYRMGQMLGNKLFGGFDSPTGGVSRSHEPPKQSKLGLDYANLDPIIDNALASGQSPEAAAATAAGAATTGTNDTNMALDNQGVFNWRFDNMDSLEGFADRTGKGINDINTLMMHSMQEFDAGQKAAFGMAFPEAAEDFAGVVDQKYAFGDVQYEQLGAEVYKDYFGEGGRLVEVSRDANGYATYDWSPHLTGGAATRDDSMTGLSTDMQQRLHAMYMDAPEHIRNDLKILSAYRSPETQQQLWEGALRKYGSAAAARKWVAPPGNSQHNHGSAIDFNFRSNAAKEWVHANAANYGLYFPMSWEPWHAETMGTRGSAQFTGDLGASGGEAPTPMFGGTGSMGTASLTGEPAQWAAAISTIESDGSGGYSAIGPWVGGDRAYGKYQVMGDNLGAWTERWVGRRMSPEEFIASPEAQDAVFAGQFGEYVQKHGSPAQAASVWFTGRTLEKGGAEASDGYITGNTYVNRFNNSLASIQSGDYSPADFVMQASYGPGAYNPQGQGGERISTSGSGSGYQDTGTRYTGAGGEDVRYNQGGGQYGGQSTGWTPFDPVAAAGEGKIEGTLNDIFGRREGESDSHFADRRRNMFLNAAEGFQMLSRGVKADFNTPTQMRLNEKDRRIGWEYKRSEQSRAQFNADRAYDLSAQQEARLQRTTELNDQIKVMDAAARRADETNDKIMRANIADFYSEQGYDDLSTLARNGEAELAGKMYRDRVTPTPVTGPDSFRLPDTTRQQLADRAIAAGRPELGEILLNPETAPRALESAYKETLKTLADATPEGEIDEAVVQGYIAMAGTDLTPEQLERVTASAENAARDSDLADEHYKLVQDIRDANAEQGSVGSAIAEGYYERFKDQYPVSNSLAEAGKTNMMVASNPAFDSDALRGNVLTPVASWLRGIPGAGEYVEALLGVDRADIFGANLLSAVASGELGNLAQGISGQLSNLEGQKLLEQLGSGTLERTTIMALGQAMVRDHQRLVAEADAVSSYMEEVRSDPEKSFSPSELEERVREARDSVETFRNFNTPAERRAAAANARLDYAEQTGAITASEREQLRTTEGVTQLFADPAFVERLKAVNEMTMPPEMLGEVVAVGNAATGVEFVPLFADIYGDEFSGY